MKSVIVNSNEAGQRLDKLLGKYLNLAGKGFLYKMMRKKNITLNGKKCDVSDRDIGKIEAGTSKSAILRTGNFPDVLSSVCFL